MCRRSHGFEEQKPSGRYLHWVIYVAPFHKADHTGSLRVRLGSMSRDAFVT